jgi:hypothetical protein
MQAMCQLQSRHDRFGTGRCAERERAVDATYDEQFLERQRKLPPAEGLCAVWFVSTAFVTSSGSRACVARASIELDDEARSVPPMDIPFTLTFKPQLVGTRTASRDDDGE